MKIASTIMCFKRPDYLEQVMKSLEDADESSELDWFVFQDGAENEISGEVYATQTELDAVADIINTSTLPIKEFIRQDSNISPSQQRYLILSLLNEYDLVYVFEDDLIVGKHYLRLLRIMAEQFPNYTGIMNRHTNIGNDKTAVDVCGYARLWGHYMTSDTYSKIKELYTEYYEFVKNFDFHQRRNIEIVVNPKVPWLLDDVVINKLCRKFGVRKLWPLITRGKYIGRHGMVAYKTRKYWERQGMHKQPETITYKSDASLQEFNLR